MLKPTVRVHAAELEGRALDDALNDGIAGCRVIPEAHEVGVVLRAEEEAAAIDAEAGEETPAINAAATSAGDAAPTVGATDAVVAAVQDEQGANTTASAGGNVDGAPAAAAAAANAAGATLDAQATAAAAATAAATKPNTRSNAAAAQVGRA